jgi:hypothetical protein
VSIFEEDQYPRYFLTFIPDPNDSVSLQGKLTLLQSQGKFVGFTLLNLDKSRSVTPDELLAKLGYEPEILNG